MPDILRDHSLSGGFNPDQTGINSRFILAREFACKRLNLVGLFSSTETVAARVKTTNSRFDGKYRDFASMHPGAVSINWRIFCGPGRSR